MCLHSGKCGFIASDFERTYQVLVGLAEANLAPNSLFCEWGSGFGVVACLAAMLEFSAFGIEIEPSLVDEARQLAEDFEIPVDFVQGSFIPKGSETFLEFDDRYSWLVTDEGDAHEELGLSPEEFGIVFAYPWPDEEQLFEQLFEHYTQAGTLLVTYHGSDEFRVRQ